MLIMNEISLLQGAQLLPETNEGGRGWHRIDIEKEKSPTLRKRGGLGCWLLAIGC